MRHLGRVAGVVALLALLGSCVPRELDVAPAPEFHDPDFRIGILIDAPRATLGGGAALRVTDANDGGTIALVAPQQSVDAVPRGGDIALLGGAGPQERIVLVVQAADSGGLVRLNGRDYRGTIELRRGSTGVLAVNRVGLESYVAGVVGAEMGARQPNELEALKAQAIVSRTYALKHQNAAGDRGYDLVADVDNQVYNGAAAENALATRAALETRGEVVTYGGVLIDAFFFSTCSGRTEDGTAVFAGADRPYLRAVDDLDPTGTPWCAASPRYEWHEGWTASEFRDMLRRTLTAANLPADRAADLTDVRVSGHTGSGRVSAVDLVGQGGRTTVSGPAIRRVLMPTAGGLLRSTNFTVRIARDGGVIERVDLDGRGSGHGVGMCQWGAIGRARAGQDAPTIVASYFPGTEIRRVY